MKELDGIQKNMLKEIAGYEQIPEGAFNLRSNGELAVRQTTANIDIQTKKDKPGIDIIIKPNTKNERVDIPVLLTKTGVSFIKFSLLLPVSTLVFWTRTGILLSSIFTFVSSCTNSKSEL